MHTRVSLRVAEALKLFLIRKLPWVFEAPKASDKEVSVYNLDEYMYLLKQPGVTRITGVQYPFGARSSKPTDWMHYGMSLDGMPSVCSHPKVTWFNQLDGLAVFARHRPTSGTATYERSVKAIGVCPPCKGTFVSTALEAYPVYLNGFWLRHFASPCTR